MYLTLLAIILLLAAGIACAMEHGHVKRLKKELRRMNLNYDNAVLFFGEERSKVGRKYEDLAKQAGENLCATGHIRKGNYGFLELLGGWTVTYYDDLLGKPAPEEVAEKKLKHLSELREHFPELTDEAATLLGRLLVLWYRQTITMDAWLCFAGYAGCSETLDIADAVLLAGKTKQNREMLALLPEHE